MPNFKGDKWITLQSNDDKVPYIFEFPPCSTADANDGAIPYGDSLTSTYDIKVYKVGSTTDVYADIVDSKSQSGNAITLNLKYPTTNGVGKYKITFILTLTSNAVIEFDFDRLLAENI